MEETKNKTLLDQLAIFYYRKWLLIIPIIIGGLIGLLVSFKLPEYYSSSTLILAEDQQVPEEYVPQTDRTPFSQRLTVLSQQILSRTRLEQIIKEFNLYENASPGIATRLGMLYNRVAHGEAQVAATSDVIIDQMRSDIKFEVAAEVTTGSKKGSSSGGNAFSIYYTGTDPKTTMQVTNKLASLFIEENLKAREQYAEGTSEFLGSELEKAKTELEQLERQIKGFKETHMGGLPEQLDANLRTLDRLQMELQTVSASIKSTDDRRILLQEQMAYAPTAATGRPINPQLAELEKLRGELVSLLSMYKESYPDVIITKRRIKDLETQLGQNGKTDENELRNPTVYVELSTVKSQLAALRQRESEIRRQIKDYERRIDNTPANEQKQADILRDHRISLANYQALLEKKLNARLAENLEKRQKGERFRVIDYAYLPQVPDWPNKGYITLYGVLGGVALGAGLVLLFEVLNPAFRKPEDFEGVIMSPVLTSIPIFPFKDQQRPENKLRVIKGRKESA
ncbi:MAG: hypothetical protein HYS21_05365 [Deltaproteobacteria bacterium]|nr:hypothetical protein [Deltaproteobacteria bacterium]